jgi:MoxR-like ATPase
MDHSVPRPPASAAHLSARFEEAARILGEAFLDKQDIIRLLLVSAIAGEHMILIGPPGTAKSALVRRFSQLIDARYFEYLLTRFTEPNELFGPVDIREFREGRYKRRTEGMLPDAEIVFLDEIFKSNSAILNSLLSILNERRFASGGQVLKVPLISLFAASNEVPSDEQLAAMFDRFLLRVVSDNLDSYHFHNLVQKGLENEVRVLGGKEEQPIFTALELRALHARFHEHLRFGEDFLAKYKGLIFQIRSEGITVSDRRVVKLLKLFAASALLDGRAQANDGDFFVLKHIWNNLDQVELLEEIVNPVLDAHFRAHPDERRLAFSQAGLDDLLAELKLIRELFTGGGEMSDIQLFSQLRNLNEIKAALQAMGTDTAKRMLAEVDQLLETVFSSSKFGG